jgi:L-ribulose-5-phosphate 3-epimerase
MVSEHVEEGLCARTLQGIPTMTEPTRESAPRPPRLAVCSWSLQPGSTTELISRVQATGLNAVQLALDPVRTGVMPLAEVQPAFERAGLTIVSGMMDMASEDYTTLESIRRTGGVSPDETWPQNRAAAQLNARLARALDIRLVTFHAGFLPHEASDPRRTLLLDRVRDIVTIFADEGVAVALETGQETADTLVDALDDIGAGVGVNFDPANMILYGMGDPLPALRRLAPWVRQVHIKDAIPSLTPGEWGVEVPVGSGAVDWTAFFTVLAELPLQPDLVIEREAGTDRVTDVRTAQRVIAAASAARRS